VRRAQLGRAALRQLVALLLLLPRCLEFLLVLLLLLLVRLLLLLLQERAGLLLLPQAAAWGRCRAAVAVWEPLLCCQFYATRHTPWLLPVCH
jgi:hypothetical protein